MQRLISMLFVFLIATVMFGCAEQPRNTADGQRDRAEKNQGELSSEVKK